MRDVTQKLMPKMSSIFIFTLNVAQESVFLLLAKFAQKIAHFPKFMLPRFLLHGTTQNFVNEILIIRSNFD